MNFISTIFFLDIYLMIGKVFFCPKKVVLDPGSSLEPTTKAFRYSQESQYG